MRNRTCWFLALLLTSPSTLAQPNDPNVTVPPEHFAHLTYRCVGPTRGGRVTAITGVIPQLGTYYMGATGGGVWKTEDDGETWNNVSDGFFTTGSIGAIAVAPSDPNVVWVGTGSDGLRSNVIGGRGVWRSRDAGATWTFAGLRDVGQIGAVLVHPTNPNVCLVAAIGMAFGPTPERGVYRTRDGGTTWEHVLFVSETCGAVDLEWSPANPDELYACTWRAERKPWTIVSGGREGGIHRSRDGGTTWTKLAGGLPDGLFGKSDLAVCTSAPDVVYALIEAEPGGGLYRSDDRGDTWTFVSDRRGLLDRPFYYCNVDVDPNDVDHVFVSATGMHESSDGGKTWRRMRTPHGDNHGIWIHPADSKRMIQCNDGGANVSKDGGRTWSTQRNQPTAELYQVAVDDRHPYWLYAGQQDNSTIRVPSAPVRGHSGGPDGEWESVGGCETGPAIPKPGDPDTVYAACKGRFGVWDARTGQERQYYVGMLNMYGHDPADLPYRFQRVSPIHVSPHDPNVIYHGSQYVHRTTDEGRTWETISPDLTAFVPETQGISGEPITRDVTGEEFYSTLYVIRESPLEPGLIWTGANDGPIHVTHDGGGVWLDVTPPDLPPGGRVQCIEPSPHDADRAYVAVYRYLLGDWEPYVYRTTDRGVTWTRLTTGENGIPIDTPTRVVREDPDRAGLLYVGTEFGMYVSFDDGAHWQSFQQNLPVTPVTDLVVHRKDLVLSTMGRSFWILDDLSCLHQLETGRPELDLTLFAPRDAIRERAPRGGRGSSTAFGVPAYAPAGARIDTWVPAGLAVPLVLTVEDENGAVVATFRSDPSAVADEGSEGSAPRSGDEDEDDPAERGGMVGPGSGAGFEGRGGRGRRTNTPTLDASPGAHRFHWDLRAGRGPVPPGTYTLRLAAGDVVRTAPLVVRLDPNLVARGITEDDVREQHAFLERVDALSARANTASDRVDAWLEHLRHARTDHGSLHAIDAAEAALLGLRDRLETRRDGAYQQPMLRSQLSYLRSNAGRADQAPGNHAYERLAAHDQELSSIERALERIVEPSLEPARLTVERLFHGIEFLQVERPAYRWAPDGSRVAGVERTADGAAQIVSYDVPSGRRRVVTALDGAHPWSLAAVESAGRKALRYVLHAGDERHVWSDGKLEAAGKSWDVEVTAAADIPDPVVDTERLLSPDGTHAVVASSAFFVPPRLEVVATADGAVVRTLHANDLLRAKHAALAPTRVERTSVDLGARGSASAFLLFPPDFDTSRRWAAVFVPGAPDDTDLLADRWTRDHAWWRLLAHEGYVVVGLATHGLPSQGRVPAFDAIVARLQEEHPYLDRERAAWIDLHAGALGVADLEPRRFAAAAFDVGRAPRTATPIEPAQSTPAERDRPALLLLLEQGRVSAAERSWIERWQITEDLRQWTFPRLPQGARWRRSREVVTRFLLEVVPPGGR